MLQQRLAELAYGLRKRKVTDEGKRAKRDDDRDDAGFLSSLITALPGYVVRADADLRVRYFSRVPPGMKPEDIMGRVIWDFVGAANVADAQSCVANVLETSEPDTFETILVGPNGEQVPHQVFVSVVNEREGRLGVCMVIADRTKAHRREQALLESEEKLRIALAAAGMGLWTFSAQADVTEWDAQMCAIHGRSDSLDPERYVAEAVHPDDREACWPLCARIRQAGSWEGPVHRIVRPDGTIRWVLSRGLTVVDEHGCVVRMTGGTIDVTAHRALEDQLRRSQRVDAIGQLTTGITHNFNNMLTVLTNTLDALERRVSGDDAQHLLQDARGTTERAAEMVRQLMTFAGQRPAQDRSPHAIGPLVERAVDICRRMFDRHIVLELSIAEGLPEIVCSESEIEQILMNVLLNARDSVLLKGKAAPRIRVTVDRAPPPGVPSGTAYVRIQVEDEGTGMSADVIARVFDPFFTTKEIGRGTGLGLATSYAITRELGGTLMCSSTEGIGAVFDLFLPAATRDSQRTPVAEPKSTSALPRFRVLVVDDEPPIQRSLSILLDDAGFDVDTAGNGEDAVARLAASPDIDVVLLDRSMPGGPGETFIPRMRAVSPSSKIVLFTGRAVEPSLARQVDGVLQKPAPAALLVDTITSVLDAAN